MLWTEALLHDNKGRGLIRVLIKELFELSSLLKIISLTDFSGLQKNLTQCLGKKKTLMVWFA